MLQLLLWRHLVFYSEGRHINNPDLKGSIAHTMRFASSPDIDTLHTEAQRRLARVLKAFEALDLVSTSLAYIQDRPLTCAQTEETMGTEWRSYDSYRTIMVRRLADAVGLEDEVEAREAD